VRHTERLRALLLSSTVTIAILLVSAGAAAAGPRCDAPPGTSGIDQYCETLPGAKGDRESGAGQGVGRSLDRRTSRALRRAGRDGQGVLVLPSSGKRGRGDEAGRRERQSKEPSGSPVRALGSAIESGPSAGQGFIWLLLAAGVGMAGIAWIRYRRGSSA